MTTNSTTITVDASRYEDEDDCLSAAAADVASRLGLVGYDLSPRWADEDRDEIELSIPAVEIEASHPRPSECVDTAGAYDVDVRVHLGGRDLDGELTLCPPEDGSPGWASWGPSIDLWMSGGLVAELRSLSELGLDLADDIESAGAREIAAVAS